MVTEYHKARSNRDNLSHYCKPCKSLIRKATRGDEEAARALSHMPGIPDCVAPARVPSVECRSTCPICGMGIDDCLDAGGCYDRP